MSDDHKQRAMDRFAAMLRENFPAEAEAAELKARVAELERENEALRKDAEHWKEEARRYAQNADFWRVKHDADMQERGR